MVPRTVDVWCWSATAFLWSILVSLERSSASAVDQQRGRSESALGSSVRHMLIGPTWTEWLNCLSLRVGMGRTLEWGRVLRCRPGSVLGHYTRFLCERPLPVRAAPSGVAASRFVVRWGPVPFLLVCGTSPISGLNAPVS